MLRGVEKRLIKKEIILISHAKSVRIFQQQFADIYNEQLNVLHLDILNPGKKKISEIYFLFLPAVRGC